VVVSCPDVAGQSRRGTGAYTKLVDASDADTFSHSWKLRSVH
jgi:hypothetical protein